MHNKYNISIAEVGKLDKVNQGMIGIAIVGNDAVFCQKVFDQVLSEIESSYEIEVHDIQNDWIKNKALTNSLTNELVKALF